MNDNKVGFLYLRDYKTELICRINTWNPQLQGDISSFYVHWRYVHWSMSQHARTCDREEQHESNMRAAVFPVPWLFFWSLALLIHWPVSSVSLAAFPVNRGCVTRNQRGTEQHWSRPIPPGLHFLLTPKMSCVQRPSGSQDNGRETGYVPLHFHWVSNIRGLWCHVTNL